MVKSFQQHKLLFILVLVILLMVLSVSACNLINLGGEQTPSRLSTPGILAPAEGVKVLTGATVQFQSVHPGDNVSRVELRVQRQGENNDILVRTDVPLNGIVLQQWVPEQAGTYTITVRTYYTDDVPSSAVSRTLEVISNSALSLAAVATPPVQQPGAVQPTVIPLTPLPISPAEAAGAFPGQEAAIMQVVATITPAPTPTPTPFYLPPPPIPGVPPGPMQSPQLNVHPPVCDSAEYLGPYVGDTSRRIFIPGVKIGDDMLSVKVTAATLVHRAWRIRNTGTCTWGPGYELAFYGGRAMGSGGVAFESIFPGEPGRRNSDVDANRLIVPEGKPNEIAVVEVLLTTPAIPGIHQSYWRMRNPQGVFFGPIVGVTLEVVRDCQSPPGGPRIYGAPVINRFQPLGIGNVYQPTPIAVSAVTPVPATVVPPIYLGTRGEEIVVDFDVIQATNIDIVVEDPTRDVQRFPQADPSNRLPYSPSTNRLGDYIFTLYADNGSCTVTQQFIVRIGPGEEEEFEIRSLNFATVACVDTSTSNVASVSTALLPNTLELVWDYFNLDVTQFRLMAQQQIKVADTSWQCTYLGICSEVWQPGRSITSEWFGRNSAGTTGRVILTDVSRILCQGAPSGTVIQYQMEALKGSDIPGPTLSNIVPVGVGGPSTIVTPVPRLPNEIPGQ